MRVLRDAHGTPPVPNRDRSSRSLPEPAPARRASQVADLYGNGGSMRARRRTTAVLAAVGLAVTLALAGCGDRSDDASSSSGSAPQLGGPAPAEAPAAAPAEQAPKADEGRDQAAQ